MDVFKYDYNAKQHCKVKIFFFAFFFTMVTQYVHLQHVYMYMYEIVFVVQKHISLINMYATIIIFMLNISFL